MTWLSVPAATFTTIQSAVTASGNGDTVTVCAGSYSEQVLIDGKSNLNLTSQTPGTAPRDPTPGTGAVPTRRPKPVPVE